MNIVEFLTSYYYQKPLIFLLIIISCTAFLVVSIIFIRKRFFNKMGNSSFNVDFNFENKKDDVIVDNQIQPLETKEFKTNISSSNTIAQQKKDALVSELVEKERKSSSDEIKQIKIDESITEFNNTKENTDNKTIVNSDKGNSAIEDVELITHKITHEKGYVKPVSQSGLSISNGIIYTKYKIPLGYENQIPWSYPMVKFPKENTIIREPREHRRQLRGYMENAFQKKLVEYFSHYFKISGEHSLPTSASSRPYEPDISMIRIDNNLNLFIDIEIDEPYAAVKRNPMHCLDVDNLRDFYFIDRGWIVIRFTERQIKKEYKKCLAFIAKLINSIDKNFVIHEDFKNQPPLTEEKQWTPLEAQKWEKLKFREQYLGIESFGKVELQETDQALILNEDEKKIESLVKSSFKLNGENEEVFEINKQNSHSRDARIQFIQDGHIYLIDGVHARSVTELIDTCFPIYDEEYWSGYVAARDNSTAKEVLAKWKKDGLESQQLGTKLHQNIERFYHEQKITIDEEFQQFLNFHNEHKNLKVYRTEWRIFDDINLIAGTIDLICKNEDGTFDIYDWKRTKKVVDPKSGNIIKTNGYNQNGIGEFSRLSDTSYSRYCLQQNVYRHILELFYGIKIKNMYLIIMHPLLSNYCKVQLPSIENEVKILLSKNY